ncbi:MAG: YqaJ viral recombinase family protein [Spirochaetaceae bacterium]|nr:YqaJ viral recombinase family protein [Spirochaetaceae bacterium]
MNKINDIIKKWPVTVLNVTKEGNEAEWLAARSKHIGGSEAGALMGASKYASPLTLYLKKTGESSEFAGNEATQAGNRLEAVVMGQIVADGITLMDGINTFSLTSGEDFTIYDSIPMLERKDMPFLSANLDGYIEFSDEVAAYGITLNGITLQSEVGLEIKTFDSYRNKELARGELPKAYWWQCQHYMLVTGLRQFLVAAYDKVAAKITYYIINRNDDECKKLYNMACLFEQHLKNQTPPEPSGLECETDTLKDSLKMGYTFALDGAEPLIEAYQEARAARLAKEKELKPLTETEAKAEQAVLLAVLNAQKELGINDNKEGKLLVKAGKWQIEKSLRSCTSIDTEAIKAAGLYQQYSKTTTNERITIKGVR